MEVKNPLFRGLGNTAKVYLVTCIQSTCLKWKKHEFCRNFNVELPIYIYVYWQLINILMFFVLTSVTATVTVSI